MKMEGLLVLALIPQVLNRRPEKKKYRRVGIAFTRIEEKKVSYNLSGIAAWVSHSTDPWRREIVRIV
jgi:hypothetical protein